MKSAISYFRRRSKFPYVIMQLFVLFASCLPSSLIAAEKWVGPGGDNNNSGFSYDQRWGELTFALTNLDPGDTLFIADGLYIIANEAGNYNGVAAVRRTGYQRLDGWTNLKTTIRAARPGQATIIGNLDVIGSFIQIEGLNILGDANNDEPGILIRDSHHIDVWNNEISYCGGGGVATAHCDTLRIIANDIHHNCSRSLQQHSGIAIYQPISQVDPESRYWRIEIKRNRCYDNVCWTPGSLGHTDGNGIIVDDYFYTQNTYLQDFHREMIGDDEVYPHATLIEGNLCTFNGGGGIRSYLGSRVTIKNNTCIGNNFLIYYWEDGGYDPGGYYNTGNIMLENSVTCHVLNNVLQSHFVQHAPGGSNFAGSDEWGSGNLWENNLLHSTITQTGLWKNPMVGNKAIYGDPGFVDVGSFDYRSNAGYDQGVRWQGHTYIDLLGNVVDGGERVDVGAIQFD